MEQNITWKTWDGSGLEQLHLSQSNTTITAQGLITGIEALGKLFHPAIEVSREADTVVLPIATGAHAAPAASR